jgi:two-component system phosphate regulon response regulator PhoB
MSVWNGDIRATAKTGSPAEQQERRAPAKTPETTDMRKTVLIVEDEADLAELIQFNLDREGYDCRTIGDGAEALVEIRREAPDLLVLDRMLPGASGDEIIKSLKQERHLSRIPIIMLTAKAEEADELVGFALGADDYVAKPFSMKLLLARVSAVLKRSGEISADTKVITAGPISIDTERHEVTVDRDAVLLTATEFKLLKTLVAAGGRVLSRSQLIDSVMGTGVAVTDRTIDVHITSLRKKLGNSASWIQTIRGIGYTAREPS